MRTSIAQLRRTLYDARRAIAPQGYTQADPETRELWERLDAVDGELDFVLYGLRTRPDAPAINSPGPEYSVDYQPPMPRPWWAIWRGLK